MQCPTPVDIKDPREKRNTTKILTVPCGKCGACRHNRRADWSFRLKQELKVSSSAFFITLTYNDDNIPVIEETGEVTLRKKDLQNFIKRYRNYTDNKLRYYAVGEYGSKTDRPHYHILLYNAPIETLKYLDKIWTFGQHHVGHVSDASIHYITKYHVNYNTHANQDRENEFATMSRKPGLGLNYIEENHNWHRENGYYYVVNNGFKQRLPRYYTEKLFTKFERELRSEKIIEEQDKTLQEEIERLRKKKVEEPERNYYKSIRIKAKKANKDKNNDLF